MQKMFFKLMAEKTLKIINDTHPFGLFKLITWPSPVFTLQLKFVRGECKSHFTWILTSPRTTAVGLTDSASPVVWEDDQKCYKALVAQQAKNRQAHDLNR